MLPPVLHLSYGRNRGSWDTAAAAAATAVEAAATSIEKEESWAEPPPPRRCRHCRRAAVTSVAEDDVKGENYIRITGKQDHLSDENTW